MGHPGVAAPRWRGGRLDRDGAIATTGVLGDQAPSEYAKVRRGLAAGGRARQKGGLLLDRRNPFDADQTGKLAQLAMAYPRARIIIAHMGGNRFSDMLLFHLLTHYSWYARNVWFDLSAVSNFFADSPYAAQLLWVCRKIGTDRILFGSDFPLLDPSTAVGDVKKLGLTQPELRQIFYENAKALLGTLGRGKFSP